MHIYTDKYLIRTLYKIDPDYDGTVTEQKSFHKLFLLEK